MSSTRRQKSILGECPECRSTLAAGNVVIEYETRTGGTDVWVDCPGCRAIVHPV